MKGGSVIAASWVGSAAFAVTALADTGLDLVEFPAVVVALALFIVSLPLSIYALAAAAVRTAREGERITVTGLYLLHGSAPRRERIHLFGSLLLTLAVCVLTASNAPFGVLVPVYPIAMIGLWGALFGTFPALPDPPR